MIVAPDVHRGDAVGVERGVEAEVGVVTQGRHVLALWRGTEEVTTHDDPTVGLDGNRGAEVVARTDGGRRDAGLSIDRREGTHETQQTHRETDGDVPRGLLLD